MLCSCIHGTCRGWHVLETRGTGFLLHTRLLQSGKYWRHGGVNWWDSPRADLGFCKPFGGLTRELSILGFGHRALAYMPFVVGGVHWRHGDMLLHICHSLWVTHTRDLAECSCVHARDCTYWRLSSMLLHVYHLSWVTHTEGLFRCSCAHTTHRGWYVLESSR